MLPVNGGNRQKPSEGRQVSQGTLNGEGINGDDQRATSGISRSRPNEDRLIGGNRQKLNGVSRLTIVGAIDNRAMKSGAGGDHKHRFRKLTGGRQQRQWQPGVIHNRRRHLSRRRRLNGARPRRCNPLAGCLQAQNCNGATGLSRHWPPAVWVLSIAPMI